MCEPDVLGGFGWQRGFLGFWLCGMSASGARAQFSPKKKQRVEGARGGLQEKIFVVVHEYAHDGSMIFEGCEKEAVFALALRSACHKPSPFYQVGQHYGEFLAHKRPFGHPTSEDMEENAQLYMRWASSPPWNVTLYCGGGVGNLAAGFEVVKEFLLFRYAADEFKAWRHCEVAQR